MLNKEYLCPCGTQPLETERLLLRAFSFDDAEVSFKKLLLIKSSMIGSSSMSFLI